MNKNTYFQKEDCSVNPVLSRELIIYKGESKTSDEGKDNTQLRVTKTNNQSTNQPIRRTTKLTQTINYNGNKNKE
jgi:hypothetical protein